MGAMMSPSWAVTPTGAVARWLLAAPAPLATAISVGVVTLQLIIALAVCLRGRLRRGLVVAGVVLTAIYWLFGQGFGGLSTGTATDVGTAPLIALLGVALLRSQPESEPIA
jgi:type IV secretory pathway VirB2 component (pilin)